MNISNFFNYIVLSIYSFKFLIFRKYKTISEIKINKDNKLNKLY